MQRLLQYFSLDEPAVWIILFSEWLFLKEPAPNGNGNPAIGIEALTVSPPLTQRYTVAAQTNIPSGNP